MNLLKYIFIFSLFIVTACNKWKKPSDVKFHVDIDKTSTLGGQLNFTGGTFVLEYFDFEGERKKGDDVYFTKDFESGLSIPFNGSQSVSELEFMIPQGEYERIDVGMRTFDDNNTICILVEGIYTYSGGGSIPFRFEFEESEQFKIRAENDNGGNIILDTDVSSPAKIVLDPGHWFEVVPVSFFENADTFNVSGTNTIVINKTDNDNIYNLVVDRIDESVIIVFNY